MHRLSVASFALLTACVTHPAPAPLVLHGGEVRVALSAERAEIDAHGRAASLRAVALGRGEERSSLGAGRPERVGDAVHTERAPGIVEWWRPHADGLEHGVTLAKRPAGDGELTLELDVDGLVPEARTEDAVALVDDAGTPRATYAGLVVLDASGRELPARLDVRSGRITIAFDDEGARYPVVVDPLLTLLREATLPASVDSPPDAAQLGAAVAITADGSRVIAGAPRDIVGTLRTGSARIFVRSGTSWSEEATLTPPAGVAGDRFGQSVAISGDGTVALVGAPRAGAIFESGIAYVFVRAGTSWTLEATLTSPPLTGSGHFGESVALSTDGLHALVGEPGVGSAGRAVPFERTGTTWTRRSALVVPSASDHEAGTSVALSTDGSRAIVGAPSSGTTTSGRGASFIRVGTTWSYEADLAAVAPPQPDFGRWVAVSGDGSTAIAGGDTSLGPRTDVYVRSGAAWTAVQRVGNQPASLSSDGAVVAGSDATGVATVWVRSGATWRTGGTFGAGGLGSACAIAADASRIVAGAPTRGVGGTANAGAAEVLVVDWGDALGTACTRDVTCLSDHCVDGVCCDVACGNGAARDCQACSAALTGGPDGTCAPLSAAVAPTVTCRAASSEPCAAAETCVPTSTSCPPDASAPAGTICRAPTSACDAPELCDGRRDTCPATSGPAPAGTVCRAPAGACDVAELCDGVSVTCPAADVRVPPGLVCRSAAGTCDVEETCDGASPACPPDVVLPAGIVCLAASGVCDLPDLCTGTSGVCPPTYQPATTGCGDPVSGVCDAPDHCAGTSADCVSEFLADVECRASSGGCDPAELCTGDRADCPPDQISPVGTVCRSSSAACDPAESCDGVTNACPADETSCTDVDAPRPEDGGVSDGSTTPVPTAGCSCRAGGSSAPPFVLLALALALLARRRR